MSEDKEWLKGINFSDLDEHSKDEWIRNTFIKITKLEKHWTRQQEQLDHLEKKESRDYDNINELRRQISVNDDQIEKLEKDVDDKYNDLFELFNNVAKELSELKASSASHTELSKRVLHIEDIMNNHTGSIGINRKLIGELREEVNILGTVEDAQWSEMYEIKEVLRELMNWIYRYIFETVMDPRSMKELLDGLIDKLGGEKERNPIFNEEEIWNDENPSEQDVAGSARQTERCPKCGMVYGIFALEGKCPQCNELIEKEVAEPLASCEECKKRLLDSFNECFPDCNDIAWTIIKEAIKKATPYANGLIKEFLADLKFLRDAKRRREIEEKWQKKLAESGSGGEF